MKCVYRGESKGLDSERKSLVLGYHRQTHTHTYIQTTFSQAPTSFITHTLKHKHTTNMNFFESKMQYAKPIGILPKIMWAVTIGTVSYAMMDRYVVKHDGRTQWHRVMANGVSCRRFLSTGRASIICTDEWVGLMISADSLSPSNRLFRTNAARRCKSMKTTLGAIII